MNGRPGVSLGTLVRMDKPCDKCYKEAIASATAPDGCGLAKMQVMCDCDITECIEESGEMTYIIRLPYVEFQRYFCEDMMTAGFYKYVEDDDSIPLEYKYGDYKYGKSEIVWRIVDTEKWHSTRYGGSSIFAMWWCSVSDEVEESDEEAKCYWCNARGCDTKNSEGVEIHASCA